MARRIHHAKSVRSAGDELVLAPFDSRSSTPLYRQVYDRIRAAIVAGALKTDSRLPSSRSLAAQLSISRATVAYAYDLLSSDGYLSGKGAAGTFVRGRSAVPAGPSRSKAHERDGASDKPSPARPFTIDIPAVDAFPKKIWVRLAKRRLTWTSMAAMALPDFQGLAALRQTIANRMSLLRGFSCSADQIFLTGGLHGAITLAAITLLRESDMVWVEDPGCDRVRDLLSMLRMTLLPVPVDRYGVDVGAGVKAGTDARLAVVTPCYQFPLGVMLSQQRRRALADWARSSDAWILEYEDDVDFHFTGNPAPPLKAHDGAVRVLHAGAFGKALFPGLNLGYLVVPPALARRFDASSRALQIRTSVINQQVVMDFVHQGHIGRHLNRMRKLYLDRRTALVRELSRHFAPPCRIQVLPGGLHVILWLDKRCDDTDVADRAAVIGLAPYPLSRLTVRSTHPPALLLGFANETDQSLPANVAALAAIVSAKRRRPT